MRGHELAALFPDQCPINSGIALRMLKYDQAQIPERMNEMYQQLTRPGIEALL